MKKVLFSVLMFMGVGAYASSTPQPVIIQPIITVSSVSVSSGAAAVTITSATTNSPYSSGYYTYITNIRIEEYANVAQTGVPTPVTCTTSNIPGSMVFKFPTVLALGAMQVVDIKYDNPLQATAAATNTRISCPATDGVIWNVVVGYFNAP